MVKFAKILKRPVTKQLLLLTAVVLLLSVPFLRQPFHIDDRDFVEFARLSAVKVTKFIIYDTSFAGQYLEQIRNPHAPLLTTYLGLLLKAGAPDSEEIFHAAYIVFPLVAAFSMYFLARKFTRHAVATALLLLVTPAFLVLSHTLMDNLPGLSLGLAAAALYVWGADRGSWKLLVASGVAMVLGILTAYQVLSLVPAFFVYGLLKKPRRLINFLPFIMLGLGGVAWIALTFRKYSRLPEISYDLTLYTDSTVPGQEGPFDIGHRIRAILVVLGGTSIFFLSMLALYLRKKSDLLVAFVALPPLFTWSALYFIGSGEMTLVQGVQVGLLTVTGFMVVYKLFVHCLTRLSKSQENETAERIFLLVWFLSAAAVYLLHGISYVSVRHLILLFPPIILLFVRETEQFWSGSLRTQNIFIAAALFFTAIMGLMAAVADYRFASVYPAVARQLGEQYASSSSEGNNIYVRGEFDFRYYLEEQGFKVLHNKSEVKSGDIIIFSQFAASVTSEPWPEGTYSVLTQLEPGDGFPVRIMNPWAGAGFYGHPMGPLPLVFSSDALDQITVYRIQVDQ